MGRQNRYGKTTIAGYGMPSAARRDDLDAAAEQILGHLTETGRPGIYTGDGSWRGPFDDRLLGPMLSAPDRTVHGEGVVSDKPQRPRHDRYAPAGTFQAEKPRASLLTVA